MIDALPPLREVVARFGLDAKKTLGQNFLFDLNLTSRIARAVGATPDAREGMRAFLEKRAPTFGAPRTAGTSQGLDG